MSEPLRDTETIRAVKLEALAKITETLLSGGYDGSEGHMGSPDTTFTDFGEVCGIAEWLVGRLQAAEQERDASLAVNATLGRHRHERVVLETALSDLLEAAKLYNATDLDDDAPAVVAARAALSVSPAPQEQQQR